ncbi:MAG: TdeIII family type II restriction endonuclease [Dehalococcoidia bacterium]|jgi:type II restriction enzyme|nr:MAG: TdeIII family type II restriction endonuclease [Dehalococcoidia bacterium]
MGLNEQQCAEIDAVLKTSLRRKFQEYNPEPASMPFHTRLLGKDRLALYSFIHSLSTNFGTTIFEPVAVTIAKQNYKNVRSHIAAGEYIYEAALGEIQKIIDGLTTATDMPNKIEEIAAIRAVCQAGTKRKVKPTMVDLYIEDYNGSQYLFDLKTAKPNAGGFREFKRTLLEWAATVLASNPKAKVNTLIAIPYNPYEPQPYNRWTMRGMLDLKNEIKVGDEFWDFLGGVGTYQDLLDCFERVGIELRDEIDRYFAKFTK